MSVALFLITHEGIASNLLSIGEAIIRKSSSNLSHKEVAMDADIVLTLENIESDLAHLSTEDGILFITDIYGSTPSNIAEKLAHKYQANLISGVNLPMIIRLLNYRDQAEEILIQKALEGAKTGIQINNKI